MTLAELSSRTVSECVAAEVAAAMTRCFEGYLLPVRVSAQRYERRFRAESLDPFASRMYFNGDAPASTLLICRRGRSSRVAAMAVAPGLRNQGLGRKILRGAILEAVSRGDSTLTLEVFEQNEPAVRLYETLGFRVRRRLYGYHLKLDAGTPEEGASSSADGLSEMDPLAFARVVAREGDPGLPWQLSSETLSAALAPARAFHLDRRAFALVTASESQTRVLDAFVVPRAERRKGWGRRLLRALVALSDGGAWKIPPVVPEGLADAFLLRLGWEREPLNQFEMSLDLSPVGDGADG